MVLDGIALNLIVLHGIALDIIPYHGIVYVHCREEGCIGSYIPDDQEISRGPRDVPRDISRDVSGNTSL